MAYHLQVRFETPEQAYFRNRPAFRLQASIIDAVGVTDKVFLHRRTLVDPDTQETAEEFLAICSAFDLSTYPADEPAENQDPPFYRKNSFDILLPSVLETDRVKNEVVAQLDVLIEILAALDTLTDASEHWIGGVPAETTTPEP